MEADALCIWLVDFRDHPAADTGEVSDSVLGTVDGEFLTVEFLAKAEESGCGDCGKAVFLRLLI